MTSNSHRTRVRNCILSVALLTSPIVVGCSSLTKQDWRGFDVKSLGAPLAARSENKPNTRTKPLSNAEQQKLCMTTAEQLSKAGHWAESISLYEKAEALGKPDQKLDRELAPAYAANGQYAESIARYKRLLERHPKDLDIEVNLAWTFMESGDLSSAERHLRNVLSRSPKHPTAISNLGFLLVRAGRMNEAFETFRQVAGDAGAHHNMGVLLLEMGQEELAMEAFSNAAKLPDAPPQSREFLTAMTASHAVSTQQR